MLLFSSHPTSTFHAVFLTAILYAALLSSNARAVAVASTVTLTASTVTATVKPTLSASDAHTYNSDSDFKNTMLDSQNSYRSEHSASALSWNNTLAQTAQKWANKCLWKHSGYGDGENLAEGFANTTLAVQAWADERSDYNYNKPGFSEKTGHFTQLVWAATKSVGCGRKSCSSGSKSDGANGWIIVCEYWPPGNVAGEYQQNVHKQSSSSSNSNSNSQHVQGGESGAGSRGVSWAGLVVGLAAMMLMNQ
ncbi:PR-1-like protein [Xylona heveae TC161]|uniref:PR-1-like protein n=1 Tax=Xylona heveae (strain CBS 132557 / TC161) TaxID=1328760 RepID=A0A165K085_XYLHT|nr:PR-1-like protein [Xylona heveae TC161]KZF26843.1 PR-1-like protein [Xylona heveae TC161]